MGGSDFDLSVSLNFINAPFAKLTNIFRSVVSVAKLNSSALKVLAIRSDCDVGGIDGVDRAGRS